MGIGLPPCGPLIVRVTRRGLPSAYPRVVVAGFTRQSSPEKQFSYFGEGKWKALQEWLKNSWSINSQISWKSRGCPFKNWKSNCILAYGNGKTVGQEVGDGAGEERVCQRIKWTNEMVMILIIAVRYLEACVLPNKDAARTGKWRVMSTIFADRGYHASPQQCEDKFNDLNRRYKRLNEIVGRGNACRLVGDPGFIELLDLSDEAREEVRKIIGCKQLFYHEMRSYNNHNWSYLPNVPTLRKSVLSAIKGKDKSDAETLAPGMPTKRMKSQEHGVVNLDRASDHFHYSTDLSNMSNSEPGLGLQENQIMSRIFQLKETKLQIEKEILELKSQLLQKQKYHLEKERMLTMLSVENEALRLANEHLALKFRRH